MEDFDMSDVNAILRLGDVSAAELSGMVQRACDTGNWEEIGVSPKKSCKCFSRGYIGRNSETKKYIICKCITVNLPFIRSYVVPGGVKNAL